jgi:hypothetical protein
MNRFIDEAPSWGYRFFAGLFLFFFFSISPAKSDEGLLSIVSRFGQQPGNSSSQRYFWNRLRYETGTEMGDVCYAEAAYELMPYWLEDGILLRNQVAAKNSTSRIYRVDDLQSRFSGKETPEIGEETVLEQDLDRMMLTCTWGSWDLVLGRQAVSFGSAQSVNPTDLFAPVAFKPLDGEFRAGSDALRLRNQLSDTSELDFGMLAGFANNPGQNGSFLRLHILFGEMDLTPMLASFGKNRLAGISMQSALGSWGIALDGAWVEYEESIPVSPSPKKTRWLPWTFGINGQLRGDLFVSFEFHRNPMGTRHPEDYGFNSLQPIYSHYPVTLKGQDYLMTSLQYQISPLWSFSFASMQNRNDKSTLVLPELEWNLAEELWLKGTGTFSSGASEVEKSEFGPAADWFSFTLKFYY